MLEAKYFRDYKHNYMILQCGQEAAARSYQYKILTSDKIKEILRCSVRHINGTTYYYYDISSRTTLKNLYQSTKMSYGQVKDLLWQLHGICDRLAGFFMEEAGLVLLPEHIYYDFSSQRYIGLYYPDYQVTEGTAYEPLMNFLLEHIDTEDRRLAENMYRICELAGEPHFLIEDALQILEEKEEIKQEAFSIPDSHGISSMEIQNDRGLRLEKDSFYAEGTSAEISTPQSRSRKRAGSVFYPVFAVLSILGIAGSAAVYSLYDLVQEEEIALYGIMAVLGVCFLYSLYGTIKGGKKKTDEGDRMDSGNMGDVTDTAATADGRSEGGFAAAGGRTAGMPDRKPNRIPLSAGNVGDGFDQIWGDNIPLGNIISKDMNLETMTPRTLPARVNLADTDHLPWEQESDCYGNTVFFDERKIAECKLYATDRGNKQHIELKKFPCTIGKMAGCVDYVLADNSVSRIHARFDKQGDRVLMTDMNSTNGTYKNGLRIQPQETVEIEPGDEVRFGNLNYCYR